MSLNINTGTALNAPTTTNRTENFIDCPLANFLLLDYFINAVLNQIAEPENSNDKSLANSTPKACFFIRSTRTPKERLELQESPERLSMVACNGKGFALCCVPVIAVSQPVTRYRPKPENFQAVTLKSNITGVTQMIYKFLLLGTRLHISTYAKSEAEARQFLNLSKTQAVCFARVKGAVYA